MDVERRLVTPLKDKIDDELRQARRQALANKDPIEPTDEEKRNGWTTETLTSYLAEREAAQSMMVDVASITRQQANKRYEANHKYNPKRWRR